MGVLTHPRRARFRPQLYLSITSFNGLIAVSQMQIMDNYLVKK